ncbi:MAG: L,D-transpeptidase [Lachnospiraceae bacterium]|nr:L,D-transpeptidase [Lachnospiraceae bacterium]
MKKRLIFIAAALILALGFIMSGCGKDKENDEPVIEIPEEYVEPTFTRAQVEITDEPASPVYHHDFIIRVNVACNCVTVYTLDGDGNETPLRAFCCSTAREGYETPLGEYYLGEWYEWCYMADGTWGQYAFRLIDGVYNDIMFHSVPYYYDDPGSLEWEDYNKLGSVASMGCMRVCVADARWLCENIGVYDYDDDTYTRVIIYSDPDNPGPLGKPESMFIPDIDQVKGWDPTDPLPENPWHTYEFTFEIDNSITVEKSDDPGIYWPDFLTAVDSYGNDVSSYAIDNGGYDLSQKGTYVTKLKLSLGPLTVEKEVYIIVK